MRISPQWLRVPPLCYNLLSFPPQTSPFSVTWLQGLLALIYLKNYDVSSSHNSLVFHTLEFVPHNTWLPPKYVWPNMNSDIRKWTLGWSFSHSQWPHPSSHLRRQVHMLATSNSADQHYHRRSCHSVAETAIALCPELKLQRKVPPNKACTSDYSQANFEPF